MATVAGAVEFRGNPRRSLRGEVENLAAETAGVARRSGIPGYPLNGVPASTNVQRKGRRKKVPRAFETDFFGLVSCSLFITVCHDTK
jgi:hypothetical protein